MIVILFIVLVFLWLIQRQWKMRRILKIDRLLRSKCPAWPIVGHGHMFLGSDEDRMQVFQKFGREAIESKYGLISGWFGSKFCVLTCDSTIAQIITKNCLARLDESNRILERLLGNASLIAPVHQWRQRRKWVASTFSAKIRRRFVDTFAEQSMVLTHCLKSKAGNGTFSIWNNITSYAMDSAFQTTLGVNLDMQRQSLHPFLSAFGEYTKLSLKRVLQPWLRWEWLFHHLPVYKEAEKHKETIHEFVDDIIKKKMISLQHERNKTQTSSNSQSQAQETSIWDLLIASSDRSREYTATELREEILLLIVAGIDTTAVGASFVAVMLSRHWDVQEKAYEEICNIFGDSKRPISHEDLPRLKYLEAAVKETIRLFPPVPFILREPDIDVKLNSEITLPAGVTSIINLDGLHRNPQYWGADAEEFNPDRFLQGPLTDRAAYMPFGYGPRECLGYQQGMASMKVLLATLLRDFKLLPPSDVSPENLRKPFRLEFGLIMKDANNFKLRLEQRV